MPLWVLLLWKHRDLLLTAAPAWTDIPSRLCRTWGPAPHGFPKDPGFCPRSWQCWTCSEWYPAEPPQGIFCVPVPLSLSVSGHS